MVGTNNNGVYNPNKIIRNPPKPEDLDLPTLLANQTHLGHHTSLWNPANSSYIYGIREGIHIISLDITYAYLRRAAKVVQEVARRGGLILFIGTRRNQEEIVTRASERAGGYHIFHRWVPGTLTNGQQLLDRCAIKAVDMHDNEVKTYTPLLSSGKTRVLRPDLVIVLNPLENEVCLHECGLNTVPTIGVIDTDANPSWVTYPIPANDDSLRSIALIAGVLSQAAAQGQADRLDMAAQGKTTYDTKAVNQWLAHAQVLYETDISEARVDDDAPEGSRMGASGKTE
jgi:small subunit ribosomal protein S2